MNLIFVEFPMPSFDPKCPKKFAARVVTAARTQGLLIPTPCCNCGKNFGLEAHHEDYSKPNVIVWLCKGCHRKRHSELGTFKWKEGRRGPGPRAKRTPEQIDRCNAETRALQEEVELRRAAKLISMLPRDKQDSFRQHAQNKGQTIVATLKECLLKVADEINASRETAAHA